MGEEEILELMTALMNPQESTYERNLHTLGYTDPAVPSQIDIYQLDFGAKEVIENFLKEYNARMESEGQPDKVLRIQLLNGKAGMGLLNVDIEASAPF